MALSAAVLKTVIRTARTHRDFAAAQRYQREQTRKRARDAAENFKNQDEHKRWTIAPYVPGRLLSGLFKIYDALRG